jgi:hypothetical protein
VTHVFDHAECNCHLPAPNDYLAAATSAVRESTQPGTQSCYLHNPKSRFIYCMLHGCLQLITIDAPQRQAEAMPASSGSKGVCCVVICVSGCCVGVGHCVRNLGMSCTAFGRSVDRRVPSAGDPLNQPLLRDVAFAPPALLTITLQTTVLIVTPCTLSETTDL